MPAAALNGNGGSNELVVNIGRRRYSIGSRSCEAVTGQNLTPEKKKSFNTAVAQVTMTKKLKKRNNLRLIICFRTGDYITVKEYRIQ